MQRRMFRAAVMALSTLAAAGLPAQSSQQELIAARDKKLQKPVFKKADWIFDYDAARAEAKKQGKVIFTYFSRSYAY